MYKNLCKNNPTNIHNKIKKTLISTSSNVSFKRYRYVPKYIQMYSQTTKQLYMILYSYQIYIYNDRYLSKNLIAIHDDKNLCMILYFKNCKCCKYHPTFCK